MSEMDKEHLYEINKQYFALRDMRRSLLEMPNYKECFNCNNVLPISEFSDNNKKYQRPAGKGKNHWCNTCVENREKFQI